MNAAEAAEEGRETRREGSPTPSSPRSGRGSVPTFLFISFVLFMLTNNRGEELDARYRYMKALDSLNDQVANYSAWLRGYPSNFSLVRTLIYVIHECQLSVYASQRQTM